MRSGAGPPHFLPLSSCLHCVPPIRELLKTALPAHPLLWEWTRTSEGRKRTVSSMAHMLFKQEGFLYYFCFGDRRNDLLLLLLLFSSSFVSHSLQPCGLQHARLPCPLPSPGACSNSCPLSWWCHLTISSSVILFSSCLQSFPASGSFLMSRLFKSGGQVLELQLQHQSFQWIFSVDFL